MPPHAMARSEISTTGRSVHPWRARALRAGTACLSAAAPGLAAVAAERLFLTPPRARHRRMPRALAGADAFALTAAGVTVRGWRIGEGPAVLLVHGWGGRASQLLPLAEPLLGAGCSLVTFDAPAHGLSTGRIASALHFAAAIEAVAARVSPRALIAHSMGAAAAALAIARGLPLDAAVFIGPARSPEPFFEHFCDALRLPAGVSTAVRRRLAVRLGVAIEEVDVARIAAAARVPLLVAHDREDREVAWHDGAAIAAAWPGARLFTSTGLGHRHILRDRAIQREVSAFVLEHLARCGTCGRLSSEADDRCAGCRLADELYQRRGPRVDAVWEAPRG
jgi:pimeloyl-ACP methyl ester carboxylesterase